METTSHGQEYQIVKHKLITNPVPNVYPPLLTKVESAFSGFRDVLIMDWQEDK